MLNILCFKVKQKPALSKSGRMFRNRIRTNGSTYLAEPYSPTSVHCRQDKPAQYFKSCAHDYLYFRVFDALSSELLGFIL